MDGLPYTSEGPPASYGTQPQPVLPYSAPHTISHHEASSIYVTAQQMLPRQLSSHYDPGILPPPPPPRARKRRRSESVGDNERNLNRDIGMQQSSLPGDGSISMPEPPDSPYPVNTYPPSLLTSGPGFPPSMAHLPPPQHHHHYLPRQTLYHPNFHRRRTSSCSVSGEHVSVVGEPGMPAPAPKPTRDRTQFTLENDRLIIELKEKKGLGWRQIADFFPGRNWNTLQVRYCNHLKPRDVDWTDELVHRLRDAMDEHYANMWKIVSRKLPRGFTAETCRMKAIDLGWAMPGPEDDFKTSSTRTLVEQASPNKSAKSGARGRGKKEELNTPISMNG